MPKSQRRQSGARCVEIEQLAGSDSQHAQNVWYGLSLGSVLLLAAIGLAITFGVMGVINMAHGEMVMLGAYTTFVVQEMFRAYAPEAFRLVFAGGHPAGVRRRRALSASRSSVASYNSYTVARWRPYLRPGVSASCCSRRCAPSSARPIAKSATPSYMTSGFDFLGLAITYNRLWIIVFALVVFALLLLVLRSHNTRAANAGGDAEPPDGRLHGHSHRLRRCHDIWTWLRHCRNRRRGV